MLRNLPAHLLQATLPPAAPSLWPSTEGSKGRPAPGTHRVVLVVKFSRRLLRGLVELSSDCTWVWAACMQPPVPQGQRCTAVWPFPSSSPFSLTDISPAKILTHLFPSWCLFFKLCRLIQSEILCEIRCGKVWISKWWNPFGIKLCVLVLFSPMALCSLTQPWQKDTPVSSIWLTKGEGQME